MAEKTPKIEQLLLTLLGDAMYGTDRFDETEVSDWRFVWYEAYMQAVSLTVFANRTLEGCDEKALSNIRKSLKEMLLISLQVNKEHIKLHRIMTEAGIPYVIIKGMASARYYPDPVMRSMGDVDFLVDKENADRACEVLEKHGFKRNPKEHEKHIVYDYENGHYEMHIEPAGIPKGRAGDKVRALLRGIVEDSAEYESVFGTVRVPSDFHHGLVILLHTCCHLTEEGIGLRQLCDWAAFISRFSDEEFTGLFEEKLKAVGLWKLARVLTQVCVEYLGCPSRSFVGDVDKALTEGVIRDIFKSGNLGQKNPTNVQESLFVTEGDTKRSALRQIISSVNEIVYFYWNITRKVKILLPLGWLYFGMRYILRSLTGKRPKINIKTIKEKVKTRNDLYEEMKLFEE